MKYKPALKHELKEYVEWKLRAYHEDKRILKEYTEDTIPSPTPNYSATGGGRSSGESRPTENIMLKLISDQCMMRKAQTVQAIEAALGKASAEDLRLINLVYWQNSHTITGAALVLHIAPATAYRRINSVLCAIAFELGESMQ